MLNASALEADEENDLIGDQRKYISQTTTRRAQSLPEESLRDSMRPHTVIHPYNGVHSNQTNNITSDNNNNNNNYLQTPTNHQPPHGATSKRLKSCGQLQSALVTLAIQEGDVMQLWRLLSRKDVNINETDGIGMQPIHYACLYAELEILKVLLQQGANIDAATSKGDFPLDIAVTEGNFEVAQYLVSRGARIKTIVNGILDKDVRRRTYSGPCREQRKKKSFTKIPYEI